MWPKRVFILGWLQRFYVEKVNQEVLQLKQYFAVIEKSLLSTRNEICGSRSARSSAATNGNSLQFVVS